MEVYRYVVCIYTYISLFLSDCDKSEVVRVVLDGNCGVTRTASLF